MSGTEHRKASLFVLSAVSRAQSTPRHRPRHNRKTQGSLDNNDHSARPAATPTEARGWTQILSRYRQPSDGRGIVEIAITVVPLVVLWALAWFALKQGYWLSLLITVPAAGFLVRLFMIQHDCGHGAFFRHRLVNDWVGRVIGVLTLTPYDFWRRTHALHHATSGNLDRRGFGDIDTLTVREYRERPLWGRLKLSPVPTSAGDVRHRPGLSVRVPAPAAGRPDARRLACPGSAPCPPTWRSRRSSPG